VGAWSSYDVGEGGVFDGLVLGGEVSVVLALVFAPGGAISALSATMTVLTMCPMMSRPRLSRARASASSRLWRS
jgi:hypothetical protein